MSASVIDFNAVRNASSTVHDSEPEIELYADIVAEDSSDASASSYQEGWIISYVDILTLLLTLFIILLAVSHFQPDALSLHQSDIEMSTAEKQNPQLAQRASVDIQVSSIAPIAEELEAEKHEQMQSQINGQNGSTAIMHDEELVSPAIADVLKTGEHTLNTAEAGLVRMHELDPFIEYKHEYLDLDTAGLFDRQIDIAKIFPLHSGFDEMPNDQEEDAPTQQQGVSAELALANNHEQDTATVAHERDSALLSKIKNSQLGAQIEISEVKDRVNLEISDHVLFAQGSADLKAEGMQLLEQLAGMINGSLMNISVEGHTDNVPINNTHFPSNWELSTTRATLVTRHLIENDITPDRIRAIGYADTRPRADNGTIQGRERNRRVSIILHMPEADTREGG